MNRPGVFILKELLRCVEAGEIVVVDCSFSSATEETTAEASDHTVNTSVRLTGEMDWSFVTRTLPQRSFGDHVERFVGRVEEMGRVDSAASLRPEVEISVNQRIDWVKEVYEKYQTRNMEKHSFLQVGNQALESLCAAMISVPQHLNLYRTAMKTVRFLAEQLDEAAA